MPSKCALHVASGLDIGAPAWEIRGMDEPRAGGPHGLLGVGLFTRSARASRLAARAGASATGSVGASGRGGVVLTLVLLSLAAILGAGLACHVPQPSVGTGGQSGDEGSRPTTPWLGAGGAAPDLGARR